MHGNGLGVCLEVNSVVTGTGWWQATWFLKHIVEGLQ
jgi:hypothetical protein